MKKPDQCTSIEEIREAIDEIDKSIIASIAQRALYVHEAAKFKASKDSVRAEERVSAMLRKRREWAESYAINPLFIENMFRAIVNHFINEEMSDWKKRKQNHI
jgi:isochorismate pyruvate lyase